MKKVTQINNKQSGFSLVELMVVVAIIGILATLSAGSIQKQVAKTRQSEAKTNLSSLWSAQNSFHGEFGSYFTNLQAVKFSPEGTTRYNVGFNATTSAATPTGYTGAGAAAPTASPNTCTGTAHICNVGSAAGAAGATATTCNCAQPQADEAIAGTGVITQNTFTAFAHSNELTQAGDDEWSIDQTKTLTNTVDAIQ